MLKIWKAPKNNYGIKYVTVDDHGNPVGKYKKLSDIRKLYKPEIELCGLEIRRELDKVYDPGKR